MSIDLKNTRTISIISFAIDLSFFGCHQVLAELTSLFQEAGTEWCATLQVLGIVVLKLIQPKQTNWYYMFLLIS